jgi:hypothetical protein
VPLSAYAAGLLRMPPRIEDNPYVFVGRNTGTHLVAPDKAWGRIRSSAARSGLKKMKTA